MMNRDNRQQKDSLEASETDSALKTAAEIAFDTAAGESDSDESQDVMTLKKQAAKAQENWERLLRTQADFENFRKRVARERQDLIKVANEKLIQELLSPLDHFEMGLQSVQKSEGEDPLRHGMELVLAQFRQFLKNQGVTEIEALGATFDPALHEAVAHQESDEPEGKVIQQLRKGYRLNDKLLRPASVIVSKSRAP